MSCVEESDGLRTVEKPSRPESRYSWLASHYHCLGEPNRARLLIELLNAPKSVGELADLLEIPGITISHHMMLLRTLRLVEASRLGRRKIYDLTERGRLLATQAADLLARIV